MLYLDIRPMMNSEFTGIPQTTWHMARYWLARRTEELRFFFGQIEVSREVVEDLVDQRTGRYVASDPVRMYRTSRSLSLEETRRAVAIFPHARPHRSKRFGREVQVVHDLTGILTPEFHSKELTEWEMARALYDVPEIDHFVCVSEASRQDFCHYFSIPDQRTSVAYPGVEWFQSHYDAYNLLGDSIYEPYLLVFGTFEPRKNLELVFHYLAQKPAVLDRYRVVLCGSRGWGGVYDRCVSDPHIAEQIRRGRIKIIEFVNERLKLALMKEAELLVYPSFMEGFGSPVAEALSLGVPVVLSFGGSLPEVAGDAGYYFDPESLEAFGGAMEAALGDISYRNAEVRQRAYAQGRKFTWAAFNEGIRAPAERLEAELAEAAA